MGATKLRKQILDYIDNADEELLKEIKALVENYENDQTISYTVQGKPLNRKGMLQEIADAEEEYKNGRHTSHEQLKEEIKGWRL